MRKFLAYVVLMGTVFTAFLGTTSAQELLSDKQELVKARVVEIVSERQEKLPGTDADFLVQEIRTEILQGERKGEIVSFDNDFSPVQEGSRFILRITTTSDGVTYYGISDFERRPALAIFFALFVLVVIGLGKWQGVRSLVSLGISILVIFFILIPLLLKGYSPVWVSTLAATAILFFAIFFTHGFNRKSLIAFIGTVSAVIMTGILASVAVMVTHITGFASHESIYLNLNTGGQLDFVGLFLASIIIGMLGVLDDISITQVAVVRELYGVAPHLTRRELFASAIRVGKEHVGALVNTLVLAYIGVSLPVVLFAATSDASAGMLMNMEIFASEIIRTILGSLGLIMTVPITTILAVIFLKDFKGKKMTLEELEHTHSHGAGHTH